MYRLVFFGLPGGFSTVPLAALCRAGYRPMLVVHGTFSCQVNRPKTAHTIALKVLNATSTKEFYGYRYNFRTGNIDPHREALMIPNLSYRVEF